MPDAFDIAENEIADTPSADAAESVMEDVDGLHTRYVEGPRPILNWQAGVLVKEFRNYRDNAMSMSGFYGNVSLFRLLGYGHTREAAIGMAKLNPNWRNGR